MRTEKRQEKNADLLLDATEDMTACNDKKNKADAMRI